MAMIALSQPLRLGVSRGRSRSEGRDDDTTHTQKRSTLYILATTKGERILLETFIILNGQDEEREPFVHGLNHKTTGRKKQTQPPPSLIPRSASRDIQWLDPAAHRLPSGVPSGVFGLDAHSANLVNVAK